MKQKSLLYSLVAILICSAAQQSNAAITVVAPTSTTAGSFNITSDITFTVTNAGTAAAIIIDEWVISDNFRNFTNLSPNLLLSVNNAPAISFITSFADNLNAGGGAVSPNDGYVFLPIGFAVDFGDTVTLLAGVYALSPAAGFNPQASQTFTGNVFLADANAARLSSNVAVPEPSITGLLLSGVALTALRRSRK
jgi:hypothetical protein